MSILRILPEPTFPGTAVASCTLRYQDTVAPSSSSPNRGPRRAPNAMSQLIAGSPPWLITPGPGIRAEYGVAGILRNGLVRDIESGVIIGLLLEGSNGCIQHVIRRTWPPGRRAGIIRIAVVDGNRLNNCTRRHTHRHHRTCHIATTPIGVVVSQVTAAIEQSCPAPRLPVPSQRAGPNTPLKPYGP